MGFHESLLTELLHEGERDPHGRLDERSKERSTELALRRNREWLLVGAAGGPDLAHVA